MRKPIVTSDTVLRIEFANPAYKDDLPCLLDDVAAYIRQTKVWVWDLVIHQRTYLENGSDREDNYTQYSADLYCEDDS